MPAVVLALAFGCNFVGRGMAETWAVFLLPIEQAFGLARSEVTSVYSLYLVVAGLAAPFSGMAFDRFGPRVCYLFGMICVALATLLAGWAQARWHFFVLNGLLFGLGASAVGMVPASVMLGRWFDGGLGRAVALAYAGFGTGILLMVPLAQWSIETFGWRDAYRLIGIGLLLAGLAMAFLPWRRIAQGAPAVVAARRATVGAVRATGPASGLRQAMRMPAFWDLALSFHLTAVGMYLIIPQTVAYLVERGYPPLLAASLFGLAGMLSMGGILTAGWLCDRVGFRFAATLSFVSTLLGIGCLAMLLDGPSTVWLIGFVGFFGLAQGARGPVVSTLSNRIFAGPSAATIYGVIFAVMSMGSALGAWASGALHDATGDYRFGFVLSGLCIVGAALPFWWSRRLQLSAAGASSAGG